jgi:hypothetical protein
MHIKCLLRSFMDGSSSVFHNMNIHYTLSLFLVATGIFNLHSEKINMF